MVSATPIETQTYSIIVFEDANNSQLSLHTQTRISSEITFTCVI